MSRQQGQVFMFNDQELALMKNVFSENEELIYAVRNVLLQFPLSDVQKKLVKDWITEGVWKVLKKRIHPELDPDLPLTQLGDLYQTLNKDLQSKTVEEMGPLFDAKALEIAYLDQQFAVLKDIDGVHDIKFNLNDFASLKGKSYHEAYVHTTARNFLIGYIDGMLVHIKTIAGQKQESVEELKKRLNRDSSK